MALEVEKGGGWGFFGEASIVVLVFLFRSILQVWLLGLFTFVLIPSFLLVYCIVESYLMSSFSLCCSSILFVLRSFVPFCMLLHVGLV